MTRRDEIEAYWESGNTVSLLDSNLRVLEESTVLRYLHKNMEFADLGCGGGQSTVRYAAAVKSCLALEQSSHLRANAKTLFDQAKLTNVELVAGSVSDLSKYVGRFDGVLAFLDFIKLALGAAGLFGRSVRQDTFGDEAL